MDNQLFTLTLSTLATHIHTTHTWFAEQAARQVNTALTIRNWVIGMYIREYEQRGADRAQYGAKILLELSQKLTLKGLKSMGERRLREYRLFYQTYPQIWRTVSAKFQSVDNKGIKSLILFYGEKDTALLSSISTNPDMPCNDPDLLVNRLSFSHFLELLKCDTPLQRVFYETECLVHNWNVRQLQRAMNSLLFERTGLSKDKYAVLNKQGEGSGFGMREIIRNPYILDFLGLEEKPEFSESDLEQAIINHLQRFLMELGRGFCFEARQRRITFGNKHYRIDLVFITAS